MCYSNQVITYLQAKRAEAFKAQWVSDSEIADIITRMIR